MPDVEKEFGTFKEPAAGRFFARPDMCAYNLREPANKNVFLKMGIFLAAILSGDKRFWIFGVRVIIDIRLSEEVFDWLLVNGLLEPP